MENNWPHFRVDPQMKESLKYIPYEKYQIFCKVLFDWSRTISPNDLSLIAEKAKTSVMYFNHVKRGHQLPSRDWIKRIVNAAIEITPHSLIIVDAMWL